MRSVLLALCLAAPTMLCTSAVAHEGYGNGYNYNPDYYGGNGNGYGYPQYDNRGYGYRPDFYAEFYQRYLVFLRECREHLAFHRELRDLREGSRYGYEDSYAARDSQLAARATHDLWHRDHPYATQCPSYREYYGWARSRGNAAWSGYGWGGYPNVYWGR